MSFGRTKFKLWQFVLLFGSFSRFAVAQTNNVCKTVEDYRSINNNPNCWYNYVANFTVPDIIKQSGRPVQTHKVTTDDGYILTIFRIPNNKRKNPIFLQHGLITTSANWISLGDDSLAFQLYDNGYDVWMGNYRGNQYSQEHREMNVDDKKYWDHTLDDIALRDIPTVLKHIRAETNKEKVNGKIVYIGHSLGTTMALMYTSEQVAQADDLLELQILTAPAYTLKNMRGITRYAVPFADTIYNTVRGIDGLMNIISKEKSSKGILKLICMDSPEMMNRCMSMLMLIYGPKTGIYPDKYPIYFQQHPAGTSLNILKHCGQMASGSFNKFDFGLEKNMKRYGSFRPPKYDVSKIQVPTVIITARNDWLTAKEDSMILYRHLSPKIRLAFFEITEEHFNHIDFMFGAKARELYVDNVLKILDKYVNSKSNST